MVALVRKAGPTRERLERLFNLDLRQKADAQNIGTSFRVVPLRDTRKKATSNEVASILYCMLLVGSDWL